ncbi:uncharacterized protein LOC117116158 [Anneissia japonica]|uniref:uncharacterized protein LOC117116158 n=1 Tax=Anneissia japonica TaxID=1529436 RepID=UPI001425581F|nr:uncharacterized protein LOC117116158 [Anneissia japonica]
MDRQSPQRETHGLHAQDKSFSLSAETLSNNQKQHGSCNQKQLEVGQANLDTTTLLFVIKLCGPDYPDLVTKLRSYVDAPQRLSSAEGMGFPRICHNQLKENDDSCNMLLVPESRRSLEFEPSYENGKNKFEILINKLQELVENIKSLLYHLKYSLKEFPYIVKTRMEENLVEANDLQHVACIDDNKNQIEEKRKMIKILCEDGWKQMSRFYEEVHILVSELDKYTSSNDNEPQSLSSAEGMGVPKIDVSQLRENVITYSQKSLYLAYLSYEDTKNQAIKLKCSMDKPSQQTASLKDNEAQSLRSTGGMGVPQKYSNQLSENFITYSPNSLCSKPCFEDGENQTIKHGYCMDKLSQQAESLKTNEPQSLSSAEGMDIPQTCPPFRRIW